MTLVPKAPLSGRLGEAPRPESERLLALIILICLVLGVGRGASSEVNANPTTVTVLYVEDEECDRLFMEVAFQAAGMGEALRAVVNGREAIDYLAARGVYADRGRYEKAADECVCLAGD